MAQKAGYKNVKVFHAGMPAWKKAGKPAVTSPESVQDLVKAASKKPDEPPFFVIVDLRAPEKIKEGHIPLATAMSAEDVVYRVAEFPKYRKARVVLYTQDGITEDAVKALDQLRKWKYKAAAIMTGGFNAWKEAGFKVATGEAPTKIAFRKKVDPGEISVAEFKEVIEKMPEDKLVVDVRSPEEFTVSHIQGAENIPLEKLQKNFAELPKDKQIVIYCNTGAISSIANTFLKKKGIESKYLNATIKYEDGKPVITE